MAIKAFAMRDECCAGCKGVTALEAEVRSVGGDGLSTVLISVGFKSIFGLMPVMGKTAATAGLISGLAAGFCHSGFAVFGVAINGVRGKGLDEFGIFVSDFGAGIASLIGFAFPGVDGTTVCGMGVVIFGRVWVAVDDGAGLPMAFVGTTTVEVGAGVVVIFLGAVGTWGLTCRGASVVSCPIFSNLLTSEETALDVLPVPDPVGFPPAPGTLGEGRTSEGGITIGRAACAADKAAKIHQKRIIYSKCASAK
jgi:hypothetical protein